MNFHIFSPPARSFVRTLAVLLLSAACGTAEDDRRRAHLAAEEADADASQLPPGKVASPQAKRQETDYAKYHSRAVQLPDPSTYVYMGPIPSSELAAFRAATAWTNKVLELKYFPVKADGQLDGDAIENKSATLESMRTKVNRMSDALKLQLSASSHYLKGSGSYQTFAVIESKEFLKEVASRPAVVNNTNFPEHTQMLEVDADVCHYVDQLGVRDVWVWMYHTKAVTPIETNMSMGRKSFQFFNRGSYGDVSNSYLQDDLPQCDNTYVVYEFNYNREVAEALHNYGHHREWIYSHLDHRIWRDQFVNPYGQAGTNACGNVHFPPNGLQGYDYENKKALASNCSDWMPDGGGAVSQVQCGLWNCRHEDYMVWWVRRIPGLGNVLRHAGYALRNFHEFMADFDMAMALGPTLYQVTPEYMDAKSSGFTVSCLNQSLGGCQVLVPQVNALTGDCGYSWHDPDLAGGEPILTAREKNLYSCVGDLLQEAATAAVDWPSLAAAYHITFNGVEIIRYRRP